MRMLGRGRCGSHDRPNGYGGIARRKRYPPDITIRWKWPPRPGMLGVIARHGRGAGVVVLEELEHAVPRGAEFTGMASATRHNRSAPTAAAALAMKAVSAAQLNADAIDYINAHGTSTPLGDD